MCGVWLNEILTKLCYNKDEVKAKITVAFTNLSKEILEMFARNSDVG